LVRGSNPCGGTNQLASSDFQLPIFCRELSDASGPGHDGWRCRDPRVMRSPRYVGSH